MAGTYQVATLTITVTNSNGKVVDNSVAVAAWLNSLTIKSIVQMFYVPADANTRYTGINPTYGQFICIYT